MDSKSGELSKLYLRFARILGPDAKWQSGSTTQLPRRFSKIVEVNLDKDFLKITFYVLHFTSTIFKNRRGKLPRRILKFAELPFMMTKSNEI